jgi:VWFA-related protein
VVFHQLHPQERLGATRAATAMVDGLPPGEFAAVYVIDHTMKELAGFTRDREALRRAIRTVAMTPPADRAGASGGVAGEGGIAGTGGTHGDMTGAAMKGRMSTDEPFMQFEAGAQGEAFGLLVEALDRFPGRRSVVLFSEGLAVPHVNPRLEAVIDAAAPRHVSFYTIDANSLGSGGRRNKAPRRHLKDAELTSVSREADRRPAKLAEMDVTGGLRPLAELTGGLYLSDSNDITAQLARVNADRRAFYVLGYRTNAPSSEAGTRPIEVRVTHPGYSVRARTHPEPQSAKVPPRVSNSGPFARRSSTGDAAGHHRSRDAEVPVAPAERPRHVAAAAVTRTDAGDVCRVQRVEREVQGQYRRHGWQADVRGDGSDDLRRD